MHFYVYVTIFGYLEEFGFLFYRGNQKKKDKKKLLHIRFLCLFGLVVSPIKCREKKMLKIEK
jgi:hypothetical protein